MINYINTRERRRVAYSFKNVESMTEQCHKDEVKIQNVMGKARKQGILTHVNQHAGTYMDYTDAPGFYEAQNILADAKSLFETVPSYIRKEFDNDAGRFLDFMQNPNNREAISEMGLDTSHLPNSSQTNETPLEAPRGASNPQVDIETMIAQKVASAVSHATSEPLQPSPQAEKAFDLGSKGKLPGL